MIFFTSHKDIILDESLKVSAPQDERSVSRSEEMDEKLVFWLVCVSDLIREMEVSG